MMFSRILIPTDFSQRCLGAARFAIPLAERFNSKIVILHVAPPPGDDPEQSVERKRLAEKQLRDFLPAAFAHLDVKRVLRIGDPAKEIVLCADSEHSDLIMMPTRGHGVFRRLLLGSTTAKVLHDTTSPVWTGAHVDQGPPAEWLHPRTVLCAVNEGPEGKKILEAAANLASELDANLLLAHVEQRLESPGEGHYSREFHDRALAEANRKMEQLQRAAGTQASVLVEAGRVAEAISRAAVREKADLLVIGRGASAKDGRLGANTYGIIRESGCSVVSV